MSEQDSQGKMRQNVENEELGYRRKSETEGEEEKKMK